MNYNRKTHKYIHLKKQYIYENTSKMFKKNKQMKRPVSIEKGINSVVIARLPLDDASDVVTLFNNINKNDFNNELFQILEICHYCVSYV